MTNSLNLEGLFFEVSEQFLKENDCFSTRGEHGVFSHTAVVWLGIQQRLSGHSLSASMSALVERIKEGNSPLKLVLRPGKKVREGKISLNTGGISRARERLPEELVSNLFDKVADNIDQKLGEVSNVYVLDGQVITTSRTESTLDEFGHIYNGEGEFHFPKMRVVSVHHMQTGIARGVAIGTYRDSEDTLATSLISRLPAGSIVVMDRFYEKATFLDCMQQNNVHVVVRLREITAKKLFGNLPRAQSEQRDVTWIPSTKKLSHIHISGRVTKFTAPQKGFRSSEFFFFSTCPGLSLDQVANLYRQRVRVEVFIRQLKQTLKMFFVRAKKSENVKKEIYIAYITFNLIRAIMHLTAQIGNFESERMSFTAVINLTKAYAPSFLRARTTEQIDKLTLEFVTHMGQLKLPNRKKDRSYPRVVKYPRDKYAKRGIVKDYSKTQDRK